MHIINLLPKDKQQELRYEGMLHNMFVVCGLTVTLFLLVFIAQFATKLYLKSEVSSIESQIADLQTQVNRDDNAQLKAQIKKINDTVADFNSLVDGTPRWSKVLQAFAPLPPEGISVTSFVVDAQSKTVTVGGYSPTRELVIQLHDNIQADTQHFSNIDYPLENIAQPKDVSFHFTFNVNDDLLR